MKICLLLIHDGRQDYLDRALASVRKHLPVDEFAHQVTVDDSNHELGFAGAIQHAWQQVPHDIDYVFHLEQDFEFIQDVPIDRMLAVLQRHPYLAQLVLKRQPWSREEQAAGGIVEMWPDEYRQRTDQGDIWTEHRLFWSTNPSLYSAGFCRQGWPQGDRSEQVFTTRLLADPDCRFAFWGAKTDPPMVLHIGEDRAGHGY